MSTQQNPLTYEGILELFRETDRKFRETDRKFQETDRKFEESARQIKKTQKAIGKLGGRIGDIVTSMVKGNIAAKFRKYGYKDLDDDCSQNREFRNKKLGIKGEIDLLLENGDVAILIEVKTTLETADVSRHIERMGKFRRWADAKGIAKKRYIGAVAGAVVRDEAKEFAHENGLFVIVQSGDAVEIVTPPEGFQAKEW